VTRGATSALLLSLLLVVRAGLSRGEDSVAEPEDYRSADYRSPTPRTLKGARVITTSEAEALWKSRHAVFVDVMPRPPRPPGLPPDTIWRDKPRLEIPGSTWLPDTGYGALAPAMDQYFRDGLEQAVGGDRAKLLVFYCLRDCWMSWNAAKRAIALGYSQVAWYPEGTDGWQDAGLPLKDGRPVPRTAE
jgi:PQQ-dependent catabolism-associated CXXCW motif protein